MIHTSYLPNTARTLDVWDFAARFAQAVFWLRVFSALKQSPRLLSARAKRWVDRNNYVRGFAKCAGTVT